jgi:hypothetical protein
MSPIPLAVRDETQSVVYSLFWFGSRRADNNNAYLSHDGLKVIHPIYCFQRAINNSPVFCYCWTNNAETYISQAGLKIIHPTLLTPGIKFIVFRYRRAEINSPYFVHGGLSIIHSTMLTTGKNNSSHVAYYGIKIIHSISLTPGSK